MVVGATTAMHEATDAAEFDWHGLKIIIAPTGHEGSNSNVSTRGARGGGLYQTATGVAYRALYDMLSGYQDLTIGEAEMFGKALAELRDIEDRHNPPPKPPEPVAGFAAPEPGIVRGTIMDGRCHVRLSQHELTGNTVVELETGSHGWLARTIDVPFQGIGPGNDAVREAVLDMLNERGRK